MDAFFAAIEERDQSWLFGKPIVIGADPKKGMGRGVVATANYKARGYGIHSAMPISRAWRLSEEARRSGKPEAIFLPGNHDKYLRVSENIMEILHHYSLTIEVASIDEAYLELSSIAESSFRVAENIAQKIKTEIKKKEKLTCSIGIGPNKLIAKIASDFKKPNGLTMINAENAEAFLEPMAIRKIPGIGLKTEEMFLRKGVQNVNDLKKYSCGELEEVLGKWGAELYSRIRGIDDATLKTHWTAKSIGEQETFDTDTTSANFLCERLEAICKRVFERLSESDFHTFKTIVLTVRFADFETKTKSLTFQKPISDFKLLAFRVLQLFLPFLDSRQNYSHKSIRLLGVRLEKLL